MTKHFNNLTVFPITVLQIQFLQPCSLNSPTILLQTYKKMTNFPAKNQQSSNNFRQRNNPPNILPTALNSPGVILQRLVRKYSEHPIGLKLQQPFFSSLTTLQSFKCPTGIQQQSPTSVFDHQTSLKIRWCSSISQFCENYHSFFFLFVCLWNLFCINQSSEMRWESPVVAQES